jgi:hypothetical protein
MRDEEIALFAASLHAAWREGRLGGEIMPEDVHPDLDRACDDLALYFTLGMTLNYQRNSFALWRACTAAWNDAGTRWVFDPAVVARAKLSEVTEALTRHRIALQPRRHPQIWKRNAESLADLTGGSVRTLFERSDFDLGRVRAFVTGHKARFPYLCGTKISNYWLYVLSTYMNWPTTNRESLTVAPDRHVITASLRLGLVSESAKPRDVAERWEEVLRGTAFRPIDLHTPLWLWSRSGFPELAA